MKLFLFVVVSALFTAAVAATDGFFNRLIFREHRTKSYFSDEKQEIYKRWEWNAISILFLIFIPVVVPVLASYAIGGWDYVLFYLLVFLLVDWDMIFGRIVFDDWFGDIPSMKLPGIGWLHTPLWPNVATRGVLALVVAGILAIRHGWFG